jgi:hypothetical protein
MLRLSSPQKSAFCPQDIHINRNTSIHAAFPRRECIREHSYPISEFVLIMYTDAFPLREIPDVLKHFPSLRTQ